MRDLKKEFPAAKHHSYFDTAASGLMYESLMEWRNEHDLDYLLGGSTFRNGHKKILENVRKQIAVTFKGKKENIALIPNFSYGFNALLEAVDQPKKILLIESDYPSITWAVQSRNFQTDYVKSEAKLEQNISEAFSGNCPDIFVFSIVQYINGIKIDLGFLKELKEKYPEVLFIADATQYLGTEVFDFENSAIDILITSGYKWLVAGFGNGFLMVRDSVKDKLNPKIIGFNSAESFEAKPEETSFVKHFEPGHLDTLNFGSLLFSLKFLQGIGLQTISENLSVLSAKAKTGFEKLDLLEDAVVKRENHSPIFNIKGDEKMFQFLRTNNIVCSQRGKGIRISFHFYNSEKEVGSLIGLLQKYINQ